MTLPLIYWERLPRFVQKAAEKIHATGGGSMLDINDVLYEMHKQELKKPMMWIMANKVMYGRAAWSKWGAETPSENRQR